MKKLRLFVGRTNSNKSLGGSDVKEVFKALYEKYNSDLFNFLFYMVRNREQAEILTREVYIKVLNSYNQFDRKSKEEIYLFSVAHQVVADSIKKQNSFKNEKDSPFPKEIAILDEKIQRLFTYIGKCENEQRSVLILRFIQRFSIKDTADIVGCSDCKVKAEQHKGLLFLKDAIF